MAEPVSLFVGSSVSRREMVGKSGIEIEMGGVEEGETGADADFELYRVEAPSFVFCLLLFLFE